MRLRGGTLLVVLALAAGPAGAQPAAAPASRPASQPASAPSALERDLAAAIAADAAQKAGVPAAARAAAPATGARGFQSLNPDISVIADLAGGWFQQLPRGLSGDDPAGTGLHLQELELALSAIVDPYFRGDVYLTIANLRALEVEEAAVTTLALPGNLQLRAGMLRATIGRQNTQHLHVQDFARRPELNALLLGPDGFRAPGGELSLLLPVPFYAVLYAGAYSVPPPEGLAGVQPRPTFGGGAAADLTYLGTLKLFFPLTERTSLYAGGTFVTGIAPSRAPPLEPEARSYLYGGDLYVRWQPPNSAETYLSLAWQTEYFARTLAAHATDGALYSQLVLRVARRWLVGARAEVLGLPRGDLFPAVGFVGSAALTFTPSEFARVRLSGEGHARDVIAAAAVVKNFAVVLVQLEVSLGAHGAHPF
ncbi:MAG TPA: hypothetical protein VGQ83_30755 [Polyangia bacterium]|jgi:hypothetical protein